MSVQSHSTVFVMARIALWLHLTARLTRSPTHVTTCTAPGGSAQASAAKDMRRCDGHKGGRQALCLLGFGGGLLGSRFADGITGEHFHHDLIWGIEGG
jgi:hypothetical protein